MKSISLQIDLFGERENLTLPVSQPPPNSTRTLQSFLASLGGIASARTMYARVGAQSLNEIRKQLKQSRKIQSLGAGYYALRDIPVLAVSEWFCLLLEKKGPLPVDACIQEILNHYPHGDPIAIQSWLRQRPTGTSKIQNRYHRSKTPG